ncbi:conserved hypothetical protein [Ricinus communis]|uniref:Uncharacterized protein n=2 Tax=Ricinus communis TaxID=3988 RepID=B9RB40_RICCO|nr:conserved hypothetical protein [Ricinus communis]
MQLTLPKTDKELVVTRPCDVAVPGPSGSTEITGTNVVGATALREWKYQSPEVNITGTYGTDQSSDLSPSWASGDDISYDFLFDLDAEDFYQIPESTLIANDTNHATNNVREGDGGINTNGILKSDVSDQFPAKNWERDECVQADDLDSSAIMSLLSFLDADVDL